MPSGDGIATRRAALVMLDAVLRSGRTLEAAAQGVRGLSGPDHGLAVAICGEALRRLPDLDALIDSATRQRLPDDAKARMVLRLALAQKIGLQTPDHAIVATALPLVDGGPRRLVHGVLGTLLRRGVEPIDAPRLPDAVEMRWRAGVGRRGRRGRPPRDRPPPAARPQLRQRRSRAGLCGGERRRVARAQPRPARRQRRGARPRRLRRRRLVGPGPRRLAARAADPSRCRRRARPVLGARRQGDAAGRGGPQSRRRWIPRSPASSDCRRTSSAPA